MQAYHHLDKGDTFDVDATMASADVADLRRPRAARRHHQPRRPAHRRRCRGLRAPVRRSPASRWPRSATRRGPSSRPMSCATATSPRGRAYRPTCATPARPGRTEEVVVDDDLVTSRNPDDIPAFTRELAAALAASRDRLTRPRRAPPTPAAPRRGRHRRVGEPAGRADDLDEPHHDVVEPEVLRREHLGDAQRLEPHGVRLGDDAADDPRARHRPRLRAVRSSTSGASSMCEPLWIEMPDVGARSPPRPPRRSAPASAGFPGR